MEVLNAYQGWPPVASLMGDPTTSKAAREGLLNRRVGEAAVHAPEQIELGAGPKPQGARFGCYGLP